MTETTDQPKTSRMPVVFAGHGSPMNAIEDNQWSKGFRELGVTLPRPKAILAISAHWYTRGTYLTEQEAPKTIHDFGGFSPALYEVQYPAKGNPSLAKSVGALIDPKRRSLRSDWGYDHGTWSVLRWMYPEADVPVIQLSIDRRQRIPVHFEIGRSLRQLREEGVLIIGSGNVVHNLGDAISRMHSRDMNTPAWARDFDDSVKKATRQRDTSALLSLATETESGRMSHPSPDHWLPYIYALGATDEQDEIRFTSESFDMGSISMRNVVWG